MDQAGRGEILLYETEDGQSKIDVKMVNDTVWRLTRWRNCSRGISPQFQDT